MARPSLIGRYATIGKFTLLSLVDDKTAYDRSSYLCKCKFCNTEQTIGYMVLYKFLTNRSKFVRCENKTCNYYTKNYLNVIDYDEYLLLVKRGCKYCGEDCDIKQSVCRTCSVNISRWGGHTKFLAIIENSVKNNPTEFMRLTETLIDKDEMIKVFNEVSTIADIQRKVDNYDRV